MNADRRKHEKLLNTHGISAIASENQNTYEIPNKTWEAIDADIFTLNNSQFHYFIDYNSKFPIVKRTGDLCVEQIIQSCKII